MPDDKAIVVEGTFDDLDLIYPLMQDDFQPEELVSRRHLEYLMHKGQYVFLLAKQGDKVIGYAFVYKTPVCDVLWLDYIAIAKERRGQGIGADLFNALFRGLGVFLEVEIPESNDPDDLRNRRVSFYRRLGARLVGLPYRLPTPSGDQPMHLFYRRSQGAPALTQIDVRRVVESAVNYIHDDIPHRQRVLNRMFVTDEP